MDVLEKRRSMRRRGSVQQPNHVEAVMGDIPDMGYGVGMKTGNFDLGYSVLTTAVSITDQIQTTFKYTNQIQSIILKQTRT